MTRRIIATVAAVLLGYLIACLIGVPTATAPDGAAYVRCVDGLDVQVWAGLCDRFDVAASPKRGEIVGRCTSGGNTTSVRKARRCDVGSSQ